jgi:hypothetical protein
LEKELEARTRELSEAREQQAATIEVLRIGACGRSNRDRRANVEGGELIGDEVRNLIVNFLAERMVVENHLQAFAHRRLIP